MKKFILFTSLIFILLIGLYVLGYHKVMTKKEIKEKQINFDLNSIVSNIESSDNYLLTAKYYQLETTVEDKKIIIQFSNNEHSGKLIGKLNNDIITFKIKNNDENNALKANLIYSVVDSFGVANGNSKGYIEAMLSNYNLESSSLDNDGIELISKDNINIYRFRVNKKFNLGNIENSYFKMEDLKDISDKFMNDEYVKLNKGNLILYKETDFYKNNYLYICEPKSLSTRSYNSLMNVIELLYGSEYKLQFMNNYPNLSTTKVLDKFDIVIDYQPNDNELIQKLITNNYKIMKIVYKS